MEFPHAGPAEMSSDTTLEGVEGNSNIETLPAKKVGVDRQRARSQDCDGNAHRCKQESAPQVIRAGEGNPELGQGYECAGDWRPQAKE